MTDHVLTPDQLGPEYKLGALGHACSLLNDQGHVTALKHRQFTNSGPKLSRRLKTDGVFGTTNRVFLTPAFGTPLFQLEANQFK